MCGCIRPFLQKLLSASLARCCSTISCSGSTSCGSALTLVPFLMLSLQLLHLLITPAPLTTQHAFPHSPYSPSPFNSNLHPPRLAMCYFNLLFFSPAHPALISTYLNILCKLFFTSLWHSSNNPTNDSTHLPPTRLFPSCWQASTDWKRGLVIAKKGINRNWKWTIVTQESSLCHNKTTTHCLPKSTSIVNGNQQEPSQPHTLTHCQQFRAHTKPKYG